MTEVPVYCLFCRSGREERVMDRLRRMGMSPMAPQVRKAVAGASGSKGGKLARLMPGYVFFDAEQSPDWHEVRQIPDVLKVLAYSDGEFALRSEDLKYVEWLKSLGGTVEVSLAVRAGTRLEFVSGPLRELNGSIRRVNSKRRVVEVQFGQEGSLLQNVWCSFEYLQTNTDAEEAVRNK